MLIHFYALNQSLQLICHVAGFPRGFGGNWIPLAGKVDSIWESTLPAGRTRKCLNMSQNFCRASQTGFRVDSPVKKPDARKLARCAPPYTERAREEPLPGGGRRRVWPRDEAAPRHWCFLLTA